MEKREYKYVVNVVVCIVLIMMGCKDGFMSSSPVDKLSEKGIYSNKAAFKAHMATMYSQSPFPDIFSEGSLAHQTADNLTASTSAIQSSSIIQDDWWDNGYSLIRELNKTIKELPEATAFTGDEKTKKMGEVKFLRAYAYYHLARKYGGVPIVTNAKPLPSGSDIKGLYQARDKEANVFKFIEQEMTDAIAMLDQSGQSNEEPSEYRINKWSALAFKSEAMLTAASIAKYAVVQLNGVVGIPQTEAQHYWISARNAAKKIIDSDKYKLYDKYKDKDKNYYNLFFDESNDNKERIFVKAYTYPKHGQAWALFIAPFSHRGAAGYGGRYLPTYDIVKSYEYVHDQDGSLKLNNSDGSKIEYKNPANLFKDKDPRFFASVLFPGATWNGTRLHIYANIIEGGKKKGEYGADGIGQAEGTSSGFYMLQWNKRDRSRPIASGNDDTDFISMRYTEVILNYAEAELELNNEPEARKYVNMVRKRAGIQELKDPITMNDYRHERRIELAFEKHRYWDMKRWRIFNEVVDSKPSFALWPTNNKDKDIYTFTKHKLPGDKYTRTFSTKMYYNDIPENVINNNPELVQNPGY